MSDKTTANGFYINRGDNYIGIYGKDIATPLGMIAFANGLATASGKPKPKFAIALLFGKTDESVLPEVTAIKNMAKLMAVDLWGDKAGDMLKRIQYPLFGDGDQPSKTTGKVYEGYEGNFVINAKNEFGAGHAKGFKILGGMEAEQFESGMVCRLTVCPYLNSDGFSYKLRAIKYVADKDKGIRFGGAPDPTGVIDNLDQAVAAVSSNATINLNGLI